MARAARPLSVEGVSAVDTELRARERADKRRVGFCGYQPVSESKGLINLEGVRIKIDVVSLSTSSNTSLSSLYCLLNR